MTTPAASHADRRRRILETHPDVRHLMGPEWRSKYVTCGLVGVHLWTAVVVAPRCSSLQWWCLAYFAGATLTQALFLAVHECSHNLFFHGAALNRLASVGANLPLLFPFAIAFRGFHLEHHRFLGHTGVDTDLPSEWELRHVHGPFRKFLWLGVQLVFYALRPPLTRPQAWTGWHTVNVVAQLAFDAVLWRCFGRGCLRYLLASLVLAGGWHPCSGHFLSEHYALPSAPSKKEDETRESYSYYGPLNALTWNVGYHNEHHDFPYVAWSRLPVLKAKAKEWYEPLPTCASWTGALVRYVVREDLGPWSRRRC